MNKNTKSQYLQNFPIRRIRFLAWFIEESAYYKTVLTEFVGLFINLEFHSKTLYAARLTEIVCILGLVSLLYSPTFFIFYQAFFFHSSWCLLKEWCPRLNDTKYMHEVFQLDKYFPKP